MKISNKFFRKFQIKQNFKKSSNLNLKKKNLKKYKNFKNLKYAKI